MQLNLLVTDTQDREETARFGAAPIPGKIGLALGEARTFLGQNGNPTSRNIYVSNVSVSSKTTT